MKALGVIGPVVVVLLLVGVVYWGPEAPVLDEDGKIPFPTISADKPLGEGGPDPVSLIAFAEQEFRGLDFKVGRVLAENEAYTRYYITYKGGGLTISGIMNVPKGSPPIGGFPLLMLNHGFIDPAIYTNARGLKREQDYLVRQGYRPVAR